MSSEASHPTLRDLLQETEGPVPTMLAVTVLAQVLGALTRRRRGMLALDEIHLTGAPPHALLRDPSRDPGVRLAGGFTPAERAAEPLCGAEALFRRLVTGPRGEVSPCADRLLRRIDRPGVGLEQALAEAREVGLEFLASWDRRRNAEVSVEPSVGQASHGSIGEEVEARQQLASALHAGREPEVLQHGRELSRLLGEDAGVDQDLTIARGWLEDQARRREASREVSLKLILTGAPLIFATLLTGLLGVVMLLSV